MAQPNDNEFDLPDDEVDAAASAGEGASGSGGESPSPEDVEYQQSINELLTGLQSNLDGLGTGDPGSTEPIEEAVEETPEDSEAPDEALESKLEEADLPEPEAPEVPEEIEPESAVADPEDADSPQESDDGYQNELNSLLSGLRDNLENLGTGTEEPDAPEETQAAEPVKPEESVESEPPVEVESAEPAAESDETPEVPDPAEEASSETASESVPAEALEPAAEDAVDPEPESVVEEVETPPVEASEPEPSAEPVAPEPEIAEPAAEPVSEFVDPFAVDDEELELPADIPSTIESAEAPAPSVEEAVAEVFEEEEEPEALPSSDDLLRRAGSVLNAGSPPPEPVPIGLEEVPEDDDEIVAMPDVASIIGGAEKKADSPPPIGLQEVPEEDDEEVVAMPDPASLLKTAETPEAPPAPPKGNVADRGGNLPPPPPAPIAIDDDDDEVPEEIPVAVAEVAEVVGLTEAPEEEVEETATDPFAMNSLDGFNDNPEGESPLDSMMVQPDADLLSLEPEIESLEPFEGEAESKSGSANAARPPQSTFRKIFSLTTLAAGLTIAGLGIFAGYYKMEIMEYVEDSDFDGSTLSRRITKVAMDVMAGMNHDGLYYMQWLDTQIKRVADNELRMTMSVGAVLKQDLYMPVSDTYAQRKFSFNPKAIEEARDFAHNAFPDELSFPDKPWTGLYRLSASKAKVLPVKVSFRLAREADSSDWELSEIRVRGDERELAWPEGEPRSAYPESAYDVDSPEFDKAFKEYQQRALAYIAKVEELKASATGEAAQLANAKSKNREQVMMALSQGSFFKGVAIDGKGAEDTREVYMVITELREDSSLIKGVFKFGPEQEVSKHFTGLIDFEDSTDGKVAGVLSITTVAFDGARAIEDVPQFFNPGTISRINLRTDGYRVEGDSYAFSLRMVRTL